MSRPAHSSRVRSGRALITGQRSEEDLLKGFRAGIRDYLKLPCSREELLESVRRVEDWFKDLNIFGDLQVEETLSQLRAAINGTDYEDLKDNEALKQQLAGLADQVAAVAGKLDDVSLISGHYKRHIDLS